MATRDDKHILNSLLCADVKGQSRLMGEDEEPTLRTCTTYRNAMSDLVRQNRKPCLERFPKGNSSVNKVRTLDLPRGNHH
ncbi:MAG: hypothetical protein JRJ00_12150 [Deltaproteobacteria bacterium]|nr:hypothetical protein [Deltaproteobacteria bacterium]